MLKSVEVLEFIFDNIIFEKVEPLFRFMNVSVYCKCILHVCVMGFIIPDMWTTWWKNSIHICLFFYI